MKSDIDIKDDLYAYIKGSSLMATVTGSLSKRKRPKDSKKEDVVISILANRNGQKQEAFANVNIYVADQNEGGQMQENSARLRTLCQLAESLFNVGHGSTYRFNLDEQRVIEVEATGEHVINNKILYKHINE